MSARQAWARVACVAVLSIAVAPVLHAQVADSALAERYLARGWTTEAEDELYAQVRRAPEDPAARGALGAYLASRGRLRVGATLLEEARRFGGDSSAIARRLAPVYHWLRDWDALAALPASPLSAAERARVQALLRRPFMLDTSRARVALARPSGAHVWPTIEVEIGGRRQWAEVDARIVGLEVEAAPRAQRFGWSAMGEVALVDSVVIGGAVLTNVPATLVRRRGARIGLDLFALLRPEMGASGDSVWVGRAPPLRGAVRADTAVVALGFPGASFTLHGAPSRVGGEDAALRRWITGHRWWFDASRGIAVRLSGMP
ncbi:MAG: hypothetical protein K2X99_09295 [Gemmatimonadaceae bacterium]|nr:hypothetical protein [Gemmatimonadaceae bacterium]